MAAYKKVAAVLFCALLPLLGVAPASAAGGASMGHSGCGLGVSAPAERSAVIDEGIPIVYTFEDLLLWLGREDLLPDEPYCDCGCAYDDENGCLCGEHCNCACNVPTEPQSLPCGCDDWCEDGCACGESCDCPADCYCDCNNSWGQEDSWPCGCAYWCEDGCACGESCDCPADCYCDCNNSWGQEDSWPCGCAYWCEDGCACEDECACDAGCDCRGSGGDPARGTTVRFGADIVAELGEDGYLDIKGIQILTGEYGLVIRSGWVCLGEGASITGEGVFSPVVTVEDGAGLTLLETRVEATGSAGGTGGIALLLAGNVDFLQYSSMVVSSGTGAVGVRAEDDLSLNTSGGYSFGGLIVCVEPMTVRAEGSGSIAVDVEGDAELLYCDLIADGQAVRAGGEILLDTCAAAPVVATATIVQRSISNTPSIFHAPGQPLVDGQTGQNLFDIEFDEAVIATADGVEDKWFSLRYRLAGADIDWDMPGHYPIPLQLPPPYDRLLAGAESALQSVVYVMHPGIPYLRSVTPIEDLSGKYASFTLAGAQMDAARHTLMISTDAGESWEECPQERIAVIGTDFLTICVDDQSFPAFFQIVSATGASNRLCVNIDENGYFFDEPPVGDRIGDQGGNDNPPDEPEPPVPPDPTDPAPPGPVDPALPGPVAPDPPALRPPASEHSTGGSDTRDTGMPLDNRPALTETTYEEAAEAPDQLSPSTKPPPVSQTEQQKELPRPADLPGVAFTGAQLRALMAAKPAYVPFRHGEVEVWLPTPALAAIDIGDEDVFAVRMEYRPGEKLTVIPTVNNEWVFLSEPFFAAIPWNGEEAIFRDDAGDMLPYKYNADTGRLRLTFSRPGSVYFEFPTQQPHITVARTASDLQPNPDPIREQHSRTLRPLVSAVVGSTCGVGGLGVLLHRRRRKR